MSEKSCPCTNIDWVWGDFIKCLDCGKRYCSPTEAEVLRKIIET